MLITETSALGSHVADASRLTLDPQLESYYLIDAVIVRLPTLARHLNGLLRPTGGTVRLAGQPTEGVSVTKLGRTVGYVFQNPDHQLFAFQ